MDRIQIERGITGNDLHILRNSLRNNQAIKRISVKKRQFFIFQDMVASNIQDRKSIFDNFIHEF